MKPETALAKLSEQGARRTSAREEAADAMKQIERLARTAHRAGATKVAIASAAQISRPALDEILRS